jgi:hypothetical protein
MKVGNHAGETFDQILERKRRELTVAGRIFWGYGGFSCHPIHHVQPFCRMHLQKENGIYLFMESIESHAVPEVAQATEFSEDGIKWQRIPQGIKVTGSRYALILDEVRPGDLDIHLHEYVVGVGRSRGRVAADYLRGHVDKGCFEKSPEDRVSSSDVAQKHISYIAKVKEPFAVLLRGEE